MGARDGMEFPRNEATNITVLWPNVFASKRLTSMETHYSNIEREHTQLPEKNFLSKAVVNSFAQEVTMITDHKLLVAIFKKDVASLSHRL